MSSGCYSLRVAFDDVPPEELAAYRQSLAGGVLDAARAVASERLARGLPRLRLSPERITQVLVSRDKANPDFELLAPYEKRWAALVIRLLCSVADPAKAVRDAEARGVTWADIGDALGVTRQTAHRHFRSDK